MKLSGSYWPCWSSYKQDFGAGFQRSMKEIFIALERLLFVGFVCSAG